MSPEGKAILLLTPGFPESETDSTCLPLQQQLVKALQQQFPQLTLVVLSFQYPYTRRNYNWNGTPVIPFNGRNRGHLYRRWRQRTILQSVTTLKKKYAIAGVLSCWYGECAVLGEKIGRQLQVPHYCWALGQDARATNPFPSTLRLRPSRLLALSDFIQREMEKNHGIKPGRVLYPGIDTTIFSGDKTEKSIDLLGAGSLIPLKQFEIFIAVVEALHSTIPGLRATLIGDGPERERLEALAAKAGLTGTITFTGELAYPAVLRHMQQSRILLHPSSYEGFGMVCQEALFAGASVISFVRPVDKEVPHWHIVADKNEMIAKARTLLSQQPVTTEPVLFRSIEETAREMVSLFFEYK